MVRLHVLRACCVFLFVLSGCAETQFFAHATKEIRELAGLNGQAGSSVYKVGKPYSINGVWYYPEVDYEYTETGIASWYGPNFHGKKTANGEIFDMNRVSAAHRTLPMPSIVRVTNLNSGRALVIRVNDRGPFAHGRIIDLSRRAAQLLGFERAGTAPVRVEILAEESRQIALHAITRSRGSEPKRPDAAPTISVTSSTLPAPHGTKTAKPPPEKFKVASVENPKETFRRSKPVLATVNEQVTIKPVSADPKIYVQAGAFSQFQNAHKVRALLKQLGPTKITQIDRNNRPLFRVRIGPISNVSAADQVLASVIKAGYPDATTIIE
ncbi:MAG: septal ring lytic transglycosylase RlpA family protein [Pseudomonadota bacterium]|nr:septal ring lytic transglycosylase RlpA family protein [Pseudomonadota bacterium]